MKKYLVTGGAGFVGSNFVLYMLEKYDDILLANVDKLTYAGNLEILSTIEGDKRHVFVQADICDKQAITDLFKKYDFDYVVNFAAESHVDRSIENPQIFVETNVSGTVNLLQCAKTAWSTDGEGKSDQYKPGAKFLQVSTDEVYGTLSADEPDTFFNEDTPLDPHSPYSASKASADMFVKAFADTFKLPMNITRCSNNYGPFQFPEKLIPLMINNCLEHKDLPVYGNGMQIRDWLYVRDHCKAIDLVLHKGKLSEVYNVGGHNEKTNIYIIKSIIHYIHDNADASVDESLIKYVTDRKGHDRRYGISPKKICHDLGWKPETMFDDGIKITLQWYLDNKGWVQNVISGDYMNYYKEMYGKHEEL
ncbi:MAG: dTDP-glucose 4,6-dehydratase [Eggerthellaceae bacterium]|nr:dTDP-glucose 4,6-dehydratase [Eggerthellaceae bacterium]